MSLRPDPRGGLHQRCRRTLTDWAAPTPAQGVLRDRFVAHLDAQPDGARRACRPAHLTAGALVLDREGAHALLTLHAKAHRWFQFGGHLEDDDPSLVAGALREATEESGVPGLQIDPTPVHLDEHEVAFCGTGPVHHLDVRFLAVAGPGAAYAVSSESLDVRWWPVDDLPEPELAELVAAARARLAGHAVRAQGDQSASSS